MTGHKQIIKHSELQLCGQSCRSFGFVKGLISAYSVEKLGFLAKSENNYPHSSNEDFLRGVQLKWASGPVVASWNLLRRSSQNFSKDVLLAEILKIPIWEFFNRIGPLRTLAEGQRWLRSE